VLFFILGNKRSGTSMFRLMVNTHSQITVPPESGFALWFAKKYANIHEYKENVYNEYVEDLFSAKKFETWKLNKEELLEIFMAKKPTTYNKLTKLVYEAYSNKQNKKSKIFGDKNNYYIDHVEDLAKIFPETRFVFLIRDGRDVAVSYKEINETSINSLYKPRLEQNMTKIAKEWTKNGKTLKKFVTGDRVPAMFIRYEDLLTNPENTMEKVFNFLGLDYEPSILEFYKYNDEPKEFLQWKRKTTSKLDTTNFNRYKKFLTNEEINEYEIVAKDMLEFFDYTLHTQQLN
tara:strand:- start:3136 stop:4002 length:867 start_codon:yes stop_codon:yes gene_type:complete